MSGHSIRLEIYGLKAGRWHLHANYTVRERDDCMEDAKALDSSGRFEAVCVVRETYSESDNIARESVIYHSPKLSSPPPVAAVTAGAKGGGPRKSATPAAAPRSAAPAAASRSAAASKSAAPAAEGNWKIAGATKTASASNQTPAQAAASAARASSGPMVVDGPSLLDVLPRLLGVAIVSLVGALAVGYVVYLIIQFTASMGLPVSKTVSQTILVIVFLISFGGLFVPLLRKYVPTIQSSSRPGRRQALEPTLASAPAAAAAPQATPIGEQNGEGGIDEVGTFGDLQRSLALNKLGVDLKKDLESDDEPDSVSNDDESDNSTTLRRGPQESETGEDDEPVFLSAQDVSAEMLKFIRDSLEPLVAAGRPLNAFNRFGLTLFYAGAGEYLTSRHGLSDKEMLDILCAHMEMLGHTPEMARGFCANVDEYLVNPKYFQMYEAGRNAMARHVKDPDVELGVAEAMDTWDEPAPATSKQENEFVAVLFTDIVGSTAMTQERGDEAAQLVVREHNKIVREALALHGGKEIKHTGDGIMATFSQIAKAVDGAVAMQQSCLRSNNMDPALGLGLCIGVHAGEPIHEDGDIFGTPVQMAARILSKAESDEIAVSNLVCELCTGKRYEFSLKDKYDLKGFPEPVPVFLLDWNGDEALSDAKDEAAA